MIYKWRKNSVEAADQKSWRLYQFDFMGLRNTSDIVKTSAGKKQMSPLVTCGVFSDIVVKTLIMALAMAS